MAMFFHCGVRLLRLKQASLATIHQKKFRDLNLNETARLAVLDIANPVFFKGLCCLLQAAFPALCALCYCDKSSPAMCKTHCLSHRTTLAIEKSMESLNDANPFGAFDQEDKNLASEEEEVFREQSKER